MIDKKLYYLLCLIFIIGCVILFISSIVSLPQLEVVSKNLSSSDLQILCEKINHHSILTVNLNDLRETLLNLSYVHSVSIRVTLPSKLYIHVIKREPFAVWWNYKDLALIDKSGVVLNNKVTEIDKQKYIFVVNNTQIMDLKPMLDAIMRSKINGRVASIRFIANRRYDIVLNNGVILKLPENGIEEAFTIFDCLNNHHDLIKNNMIVDMRLIPNKVFLRQLY